MAIYYMDSSGIVKRYVDEIGSAWVIDITNPEKSNEIYTVRMTCVEIISAATRRTRDGTIAYADATMAIATFKDDVRNEYQIVEVTERLVNRAMNLAETHGLRGYDAVQLAAACEIQALCTANDLRRLSLFPQIPTSMSQLLLKAVSRRSKCTFLKISSAFSI